MTDEERSADHLGVRPSWDCSACSRPWPCTAAKEALLIEFGRYPSVLAIYMAAQLHDAFEDLTSNGRNPPPNLYDRFLSWLHTEPAPPPTKPDTK